MVTCFTRINCAEESLYYDFACNRLRISSITLPSSLILPFLVSIAFQIDASPILDRVTRRGPSNDRPLCLVNRFVLSRLVSLTRRSLSSHLAPSPSRSLLTDLVPRPFFLQHERTTCCSRAHLRRACVRCYRAQLVLRVC